MALLTQVFPQNVSIKVKGSDTVLPLTQKEAEVFMKKFPGSSVMVTGGGSGVGLAALQNGTADIAQSSRKMKLDEKMKMQDAGKAFTEVIIANDALAVIVHPSNPVTQMTREQIEGIYTGKITNWKDVGGEDLKIVMYSRETSSGTYEFFKEHVMNKKNFAPTAMLMPATGAIVQSVSQTKGAIGYVGLAYLESDIRPVKVSYDKGQTYVSPTVENAVNKTYPISRPLYYYYLNNVSASVKPFIDFILSAEGQKIVKEVGYVPVK
ncbi:MAG TPA: phosphate ABC transporter substrate-binding protein [Bacteroidales bacterium]|nr:phosphate ABC transporter substrate-binding protein [Bacteroidales bacterium]HOX77602.1 phosphate ABC transporter substrate-binding protein [Bacteroidales bacterium]HPI86081.1 phosphate ABC transporter substrate-binding protein [Bacteroidales bacterium]